MNKMELRIKMLEYPVGYLARIVQCPKDGKEVLVCVCLEKCEHFVKTTTEQLTCKYGELP